MKIRKGDYGYIRREKKKRLLVTLGLFVLPAIVFIVHIGVMGSTHYGKYYSYVKNPNQQIFILTEKKNYLLSCENRDMFIKDLLIHL